MHIPVLKNVFRQVTLLMPIFLLVLVFFVANEANAQSYWVTDPSTCPASYAGQSDAPNQVCGIDFAGPFVKFYDTDLLSPPTASTTSSSNYSGSYNGGYIFDCYDMDSGADPWCDNNGAWWCDTNTTCSGGGRLTICTEDVANTSSCGTCVSTNLDCNGDGTGSDGACEVVKNTTATGTNVLYANTCSTYTCANTYNDCNGDGTGSDGECEIQDGVACVGPGGLIGTYDGCSGSVGFCDVPASYFETGTEAKYATSSPLLWGTQYGNGALMELSASTTDKGEIFTILNDGRVGIGTSTLGTNDMLTVGMDVNNQFIVSRWGTVTDGNWQGGVIGSEWGGTGANLVGETGFLYISNGTTTASTTIHIGNTDLAVDDGGASLLSLVASNTITLDATGNWQGKVENIDISDLSTADALDWDDIVDVPTAAPSDGDTTHLSTADQIRDYVIGLGYSTTDTTYSAGTALDLSGTTFNVDLSELTTSVTDADGDYFIVIDDSNVQRKLTKANIAISGFNNDSLFITDGNTNWDNSYSFIDLTDLSATSPLAYDNGNGTFSISQSNGSTNGYLSSGDWTTFNSKLGGLSDMTLAEGNIYIGDGSDNPIATSSIFVASNGFVGIGTTSPSANLSIKGTMAIQASDYAYRFTIDPNNSSGPQLQLGNYSDSEAYFRIGAWGGENNFDTKDRDFVIYSDSYTGYYFDVSSGNVAIGTTTPLSRLTTYGNLFLEGTDRYLNFGATSSVGVDGYGIRDSSGTIQVRNANGTWSTIGSGATNIGDLNDVSVSGAATGDLLMYSGGNWVDTATSSLGLASLSDFSSTAAGISYDNTTGVFSLTGNYNIPLTASTTDWNTAYTNRITSATDNLEINSNVLGVVAGYEIPLTASTTEWNDAYLYRITSVASPLTLSNNAITLDGNYNIPLTASTSDWTTAYNTVNSKEASWDAKQDAISLTTNYLGRWNGSAFINSLIYDNGATVGIGTSSVNSDYALNIAGDLNFTDPGIGIASKLNFDKENDSAWISVAELSPDSTRYAFEMSDNPDSSNDSFVWHISDWKGDGADWEPLKFSALDVELKAKDIKAYGDYNIYGPWYSGGTYPSSGQPDTVTESKSGSLSLTPGVSAFSGTQTFFVVRIDGTGTPDTFKWDTDCWLTGSTCDWSGGSSIPITGSAQTLQEGVTITFDSTTGGVVDDIYTFRVFKGGHVLASDGSVSNPTFSFTSDTDTGIYHSADNQIGFVTGGNERVIVDSSGNVAIGTTTPLSKLTTYGNLFLEGTDRYLNFGATSSVGVDGYGIRDISGTIQVRSANGTWATIAAGASALNDLSDVTITSAAEGEILMYTGGAWKDTATSSLGLDNYNYFTLTGDSGSNNITSLESIAIAGGTGLTTSLSGQTLTISASGSYNIPLTASTTDWNNFHNTPSTVISAGNNISWSGNTLNVADSWYDSLADMTLATGNIYVGDGSGNPSATSSLFVDANGNVGIGTTSPGYKLHIQLDDNAGSDEFRIVSSDNVSVFNVDSDGNISLGIDFNSQIDFNNGSMVGINNIEISDTGANEGMTWNGTNFAVDVSNLSRDNSSTDNLNLYGTAGNIAFWRPTMWVYDQNNYTTATVNASGNMSFTASGTTDITFNTGGNIGIGTTIPSYKLDVAGNINVDQYSGYKQAGNTILYASSTNESISVGIEAGNSLLADAIHDTALGYRALYTATSSDYNTGLGAFSLYYNTAGNSNVAVGNSSLGTNNTGGSNTALGMYSMYWNTTGSNNTAIGYEAGDGVSGQSTGSNNIFLGYQAGIDHRSGSNNIVIGYNIDAPNTSGDNQLTIGNLIYGTGIDGTGTTLSSGNIGIGTTTPLSKLTTYGNILLEGPDRYLNFGATSSVGVDGYGIRDNSGTIQVRNANGTWSTIGSGATNLGDLNDVSLVSAINGDLLMYNGTNWVDTATSSLGLDNYNYFTLTGDDAGTNNITSLESIAIAGGTGLTTSLSGQTLTISADGSYNIPLTASTTDWNNFHNTPSTVISAGNNLSWSGNTLNVADNWYDSLADMTLAQGNIYVGDGSNNPIATSSLFVASNGYVGIGTTSPVSTFNIAQKADDSGLQINGYDDVNSSWIKLNMDSNGYPAIDANQGFRFKNNGTSVAYIDSSNANGFRLYNDIPMSFGTTAGLRYSMGYNATTGNLDTAYGGDFTDSANVMFSLTDTGDVGIGTSSPLSRLTTYGNILLEGPDRYLNFGATSSVGVDGYGIRDNSGTIQVRNANGTWSTIGSGATNLGDLNDVSLVSAINGDLLMYNGTNWVDTATSSLGLASLSDFSSTATGISYDNTTGVFSLTGNYNIPLAASTTDWQTTYALVDTNNTNWTSAYDDVTASSSEWTSAYTNRITSATAPLDITSNVLTIAMASSSADGYLTQTDWATFNNKWGGLSDMSLAQGNIYVGDASGKPSATSSLFINANGNVGIGTSSDSVRLVVGGDGTPSFVVEASDGSNWFDVGVGGAGVVNFNQGGGSTYVGGALNGNGRMNISSLTTTRAALTVGGASGQIENILEINSINNSDLGGDYFVIQANGNVGISTTSPAYLLDIYGSKDTYLSSIYNASSSASAGGLYVRSDGEGALLNLNYAGTDVVTITGANTTFNHPVNFSGSGDISVAQDLIMTNQTAGNIIFDGPGYVKTDSAWQNLDLVLSAANLGDVVVDDILVVTGTSSLAGVFYANYETGDVGVGTSTPYAKLAVENTGSGNSFIVSDDASDTTPFVIDADGNVGIGTTTPSDKLSVVGAIGSHTTPSGYYFKGYNNLNELRFIAKDYSGAVMLGNAGNGSLRLLTNDTEQMIISQTGGVGIGTSSPLSKLTTYGNLFLEGSDRYLNFGATSSVGVDGYGIRDDSGTMEFRNANGTWAAIGGDGASALNDLSDVTIAGASEGEVLMYSGGSWVDTATSSLGLASLSDFSSTATGIGYDNTTGVFSLTGGYNIPLTASTTDWNNFHNTPSTKITAGNNLSWSGNTLNVADNWYDSLADMSLDTGNIYVGDASGNPTATSSLTINDNGTVSLENSGSAANPSLSFVGDNDTGLFQESANTLFVAAGGSYISKFDSSGLTMGDMASGNAYITRAVGTVAAPAYAFIGGVDMGMYKTTDDELGFSTGGAEAFRIDTSGNMMIGTSAAGAKLTIMSSANSQLRLSYDSDTYVDLNVASDGSFAIDGSGVDGSLLAMGSGQAEDVGIIFNGNAIDYYLALDDADDSFKIGTSSTIGSSTILTILSNGNVAIGTTTPLSKLATYGNAFLEGTDRYLNFGATSSVGVDGYGIRDLGGTIQVRSANGTWATIASGTSALNNLSDVTITGASEGEILMYTSGAWKDTATSSLGFDNYNYFTLTGDSGSNNITTLESIAIAGGTGLTTSLDGQTLTISASGSYNIPLTASTTNWNTAYNDVNTNSANWDTAYTNRITSATTPLDITSNVLTIAMASSSADGYLTQTDWATFNSKWDGLSNMSLATGHIYIGDGSNNPIATSSLFMASDGKVGIGTISPSYKFEVAGTSSMYALDLSNGSASAPSLYFNGDIDTGIFGVGANQFAFSTAGTEAFRVDTSGNMMIGTTTSAAKLTIMSPTDSQLSLSYDSDTYVDFDVASDGSFTIDGPGINGSLLAMGSGQTEDAGIIFNGSAINYYLALDDTDDSFKIGTGSTIGSSTILTILSNGNIGIGTSSPFAKLSVENIDSVNSFIVSDQANDTTPFVIDADGNVGIGTTLPLSKLDISGNINIDQYSGYKQAGNTILYASSTNYSTLVGDGAGNSLSSSGIYNIALGHLALASTTLGDFNVAIGPDSLYYNVTGSSNISIGDSSLHENTTGSYNTVIGKGASFNNRSATSTTAIGFEAGFGERDFSYNQNGVLVGYRAGYGLTTGDNNLLLGYKAGDNLTAGDTNIVIGYDIDSPTAVSSNTLTIGNLIYGTGIDGVGTTISSGNIGIGTSSPSAKLSIVDVNAGITDNVVNISTSTSGSIFRITGNGTVYADGSFSANGADYAEYFYTVDTDLQAGEVVCVDVENSNAVERCARAGDGNVMGIVSTKPSIIGNNQEGFRENDNYAVIGMLGQVPAKVSTENGPIRPGDSLTSASIAGFAMRANAGDPTVGVALESLDADLIVIDSASSTEILATNNWASETGTIKILISRRNKSLTVEAVESQITERIAAMEIEDEVQILISQAVDDMNLDTEIGAIVDEQIAMFDEVLTVEIDLVNGQLVNLNSTVDELVNRIGVLEGNYEQINTQLTLINNQLTATDLESADDEPFIITAEGNLVLTNDSAIVVARSDNDVAISTSTTEIASTTEVEVDVAIVEIVTATSTVKTAFVVNQRGDETVADFQVDGVSIMNIDNDSSVTIVGEMMVDGRIMICSGGACGSSLDEAVDETMGDMGVEGKVVAGAFESYCADGYAWVPGSSKYGTMPGFCAQTNEASIEFNTDNEAWTNINQGEAILACQEIGRDYHLTTENEWLTIAENAIRVIENDIDTGREGLQLAFASSTLASTTIVLTNAVVLENIIGGVAEWTDQVVTAAGVFEPITDNWQEYYTIQNFKGYNLAPPYYYSSENNIGRVKTADTGASHRGFVRGASALYDLDLSIAPTTATSTIGFRCAR